MGRNVWLLFCCQALMTAVVSGQVVMSALIGNSLAVDKTVATLPLAIQMAATMAASIPAGIIFARLGRRPGFWLGCVGSALGSLVFALGVWRGSFALYCLGAVPAGLGFGISQHLRFAAAEVAPPAGRPRAIALVMTGGVIAALIGPEIVKRTNALVLPYIFLGTYLSMLALPLTAAVLLACAALPPAPARHVVPVPVKAILARPTFLVAVTAGVVAYASMNLVMASTPLQMMLCGYGVNESADVIRWHSVAMYLPGFVTGRLIQRFGTHPVIMAGGGIMLCCVAINVAYPPLFTTFLVALMLLGLGWNFMFVGATALLSQAHDAVERVRVQATNDFIVFGSVACSAFASGAIESTGGWAALNLTVVPGVLLALALVLWHRLARRIAASVGG